ncbi:MAG: DUF4469 domain-containing protein [Anaerolineae bacterium]|nr:DUF4469 domain-containing protein [Anaerolineae bacterium]
MPFKYKLHPNPLAGDDKTYRAIVNFDDTWGLQKLIDKMEEAGSTLTRPDIVAVLAQLDQIIIEALLEGKQVNTGLILFTASIKGVFNGEDDVYNSTRHKLVLRVRPTAAFKEKIKVGARFKKVPASEPTPVVNIYRNLYNLGADTLLSPTHTAQVKGRNLLFDRSDARQGIFLVPQQNGTPLTDDTPIRIEEISRHTPGEIIFRVPDTLLPGQYKLEVKAIFGTNDLRTGTLKKILTVE